MKFNDSEFKVVINLELDHQDITNLANERENCDNSYIIDFLENILKKVSTKTAEIKNELTEIDNVNPYSYINNIDKGEINL